MNIGISTACLYPQETEKALDALIHAGFTHFEIFFNTISEIERSFIRLLKERSEKSGAVIQSVHPFTSGYEPYLLFTDYTRRFGDTLDFYERYFEAAQTLHAKVLVIHGDRKPPGIGISNEEYFEKFGELSLRGEKYGVTVAQENVNLFRSQNPTFLKEMREYLGDRARFVFDVKQAVRSGNDPLKVCRAMGKGLIHVHVNDHRKNEDCLLPGAGTMDYSAMCGILKENGYSGDLIIEVYRKNFQTVKQLVAARDFLLETVKKAGL